MQDQHIYRKIIVEPLQKRFSTLTRVKFRQALTVFFLPEIFDHGVDLLGGRSIIV